LLGDSCEKFDPWPSLSQVVDGSILILEVCVNLVWILLNKAFE